MAWYLAGRKEIVYQISLGDVEPRINGFKRHFVLINDLSFCTPESNTNWEKRKRVAYNILQPFKRGMKFVVRWGGRRRVGDNCGVQYKGDARDEHIFPIEGCVSGQEPNTSAKKKTWQPCWATIIREGF